MQDHSKLLDLNPNLGLMNGLFQDTNNPFRESSVSNYLQIAVDDVLSSVDDKSAFSLQIEALLNTNELRSELGSQRFNYLLALNLDEVTTALDLTQDFGSVTHFLSENVAQLDSVKVDVDRSRLASARCIEHENIWHVSENIQKLKLPSNHYDLIVIGAWELLQIPQPDLPKVLNRLRRSLSADGVLFINAKNPSQLSSWFDAQKNTSHETPPFADLYDIGSDESTPRQLRKLVKQAGISAIDHYVSFSSSGQFNNLFCTNYLRADKNALNHFYRLGYIDNPLVNEYLLFEKQFNDLENILDHSSNTILVCGAEPSTIRRRVDFDFAHFPGHGRKPQWRAITSRKRADPTVTKRAVFPTVRENAEQAQHIWQDLSPQPYKPGQLLISWWLHAVLNEDFSALNRLINDYQSWLDHGFEDADFSQVAYDLLPFNLLVNESTPEPKNYQAIDTEWHVTSQYSSEFVLFRALFWFAFENKALLRAITRKHDLPTVGLFIKKFMPAADLQAYAELEEQIQFEVDNSFHANSVIQALAQPFNDELESVNTQLECQLQWSDQQGHTDGAHTKLAEWSAELGSQLLSIDLPPKSETRSLLRIDPIASRGLFRLDSIRLLDANEDCLFSLEGFAAVFDTVSVENLHIDSATKSCLALNEDPHLTLDLSKALGIDKATTCELRLELILGAEYQGQLAALTEKFKRQTDIIAGQANRLNEYRAEMEFLNRRLSDLKQHRSDLNQMLNLNRQEKKREVSRVNLRDQVVTQLNNDIRRLKQQLTHLNDQLVAQIQHNQDMDRFLMLRPSTRIKRLLSRSIRRLQGKPPIADAGTDEGLGTTDKANDVGSEAANIAQQESLNADIDSHKTVELIGQNLEDYQLWVKQNSLSADEIKQAKAEIESWELKPVFSILVPIYNTDPEYLLPMIRSVQAQIYPHWQLCLVDDCSPKKYLQTLLEVEAAKDDRIRLQFNEKNQGIALTSNDALAISTGDYIALLDHDDELSIDALYENAKVIQEQPNIGLIYSDEDKMDMQGNRLEPFFKPDYSPDLLNTNNYVCHFTVINKDVVDRIGGFREGLDGSQDHDIILRAIAESESVVHIPKILYHWRKIPGSTAVEYDSKSYAWEAGRQAVEDCLHQVDATASVEFGSLKGTYRVFREIRGKPLVSIVIPFKDKPELLDACIGSILERTSYQNFEIIGVSNNSESPETFARMEHFQQADERIRFVEKNIPFNFSAICNYGVEQSNGEYIVLLNNDIEIERGDWLERLLEHAQRGDVGAVGGKLLYPDGRIQHAGIVVGMVGAAGHPHKFFPDNHIGYHGRLHMVYNVSAVTGAMMMVRKDKYSEVGGLDEDNLAVAYNDVDLCLKLLDKGYLNIFTPHARAIHHESVSRGYEDTEEKLARLKSEQQYFLTKWADFLQAGDPYYNPNLSLENERFSLRFKDSP